MNLLLGRIFAIASLDMETLYSDYVMKIGLNDFERQVKEEWNRKWENYEYLMIYLWIFKWWFFSSGMCELNYAFHFGISWNLSPWKKWQCLKIMCDIHVLIILMKWVYGGICASGCQNIGFWVLSRLVGCGSLNDG